MDNLNHPIRVGRFGDGNCLWGHICVQEGDVIYEVKAIIAITNGQIRDSDPTDADIRGHHRAMLVRAAKEAQARSKTTFIFKGNQANPNFQKHANQLAVQCGIPTSGRQVHSGGSFPHYEVTLYAAAILADNP